jgi:putative phosphoesterase
VPERCLELLRSARLIIHAGDFASVAAFDELRALGPPVEAVHGNNDEPALRALLPERTVVEVGETRIGLVHDGGRKPGREARLGAWFAGCDAVVYGHTHMPQAERVDGVWILNPGSPTQRRRATSRSLLLLEIAGKTLRPTLVALS